ncbi:11287_t:CDS:2, partial [Dentiscutata erythropus]
MSSGQLCRGQDCTNPSKLQCPTCLKLNISSYFCSQECFKKNWVNSSLRLLLMNENCSFPKHITCTLHLQSTHKLLHKTNTPTTGIETYIPNFSYTGSLRAVYPLSPRRS